MYEFEFSSRKDLPPAALNGTVYYISPSCGLLLVLLLSSLKLNSYPFSINFPSSTEQAIYNRPRPVDRSRLKESRDSLEAYQLAQRLQSMVNISVETHSVGYIYSMITVTQVASRIFTCLQQLDDA